MKIGEIVGKTPINSFKWSKIVSFEGFNGESPTKKPIFDVSNGV